MRPDDGNPGVKSYPNENGADTQASNDCSVDLWSHAYNVVKI